MWHAKRVVHRVKAGISGGREDILGIAGDGFEFRGNRRLYKDLGSSYTWLDANIQHTHPCALGYVCAFIYFNWFKLAWRHQMYGKGVELYKEIKKMSFWMYLLNETMLQKEREEEEERKNGWHTTDTDTILDLIDGGHQNE